MYLLDTNIVSRLDPRRHSSAPALVRWIARNGARLFLSALTFMELEAGILKLRRDGKRERADELATLARAILEDFGERVLAIDASIALEAARLAEAARPTTLDAPDLLIAATAKAHGLTVLTHNLRHFVPTGVSALDPLASLPPDVSP